MSQSPRAPVAILAVAVALGGAVLGVYALRLPRQVPQGQRAYLSLDAAHVSDVRDAFNAGLGHPRIIAFLSPT